MIVWVFSGKFPFRLSWVLIRMKTFVLMTVDLTPPSPYVLLPLFPGARLAQHHLNYNTRSTFHMLTQYIRCRPNDKTQLDIRVEAGLLSPTRKLSSIFTLPKPLCLINSSLPGRPPLPMGNRQLRLPEFLQMAHRTAIQQPGSSHADKTKSNVQTRPTIPMNSSRSS